MLFYYIPVFDIVSTNLQNYTFFSTLANEISFYSCLPDFCLGFAGGPHRYFIGTSSVLHRYFALWIWKVCRTFPATIRHHNFSFLISIINIFYTNMSKLANRFAYLLKI